ncbi:hypothetical protein BV25DRAFT_1894599 [Artomyces pyxidatus]|uniref:Uncharacterized protein n=1 Tax=Artomyces pyxidatus TaxID=48021 RepID=A0ACB8SHX9_9AGAM|nr:hypothetical protein BV25DRAFT_1894599 [Artomyces pyxidatus]
MDYDSYADAQDTHKPDKPLVVKCECNSRSHNLKFKSARTCTFSALREKVGQKFSLQAHQFNIKWTDDMGEDVYISGESELVEAIQYHESVDGPPTSSSASIFSSKSSTSRIMLSVQILVDYDGPSLSDTGSLASLEEYRGRNTSQRSFSFSNYSPPPVDDDAVTVSSKDTGGHSDASQRSKPLIKRIFNSASGSGLKAPSLRLSRSRNRLTTHSPDEASTYENGAEASQNTSTVPSDDTAERHPSSPSAVFERLKAEDHQSSSSLAHQRSFLETDHGKTWLHDQKRHYVEATLGTVPTPSSESDADSFSLNTDSPLSVDEGAKGDDDLHVEYDARGKQYYVANSSSSGSRIGHDVRQSSEYYADASSSGLRRVNGAARDRPISMATTSMDSSGQLSSGYPNSSETPSYRRSLVHSVSEPLPHTSESVSDGFSIPHELLVPEDVTDCSECGCVLDSIKYTCTTCGEKESVPRAQLEALSKGKGRQVEELPVYHAEYPPPGHRSPIPSSSSSSSQTTVYRLRFPPFHKPLPALPSSSPTDTVLGSGSPPHTHPRSNSTSSSATVHIGYELCSICFQSVGVNHTLLGGRGDGSPGQMDSPTSPQELAVARRSAPKQKGQLRHSFAEKMWGFNGWQDLEETDSHPQKCSGCQAMLTTHRYKCGVHEDFVICRACFSDVHNIHPIHPFIKMPDMPARSRSVPDLSEGSPLDAADEPDEPSMKHPDVRCYHCGQDIVGARFRCVDCTSIDVDICSNCDSAGLPGNLDSSDGGHNFSHMMLKIPLPLNMHQVQSVSQRAWGLRKGSDQTSRSATRSSPSSVSSGIARTVLQDAGNDGFSHLMFCNSCGKDIVGDRYQCLSCPSKSARYNLCTDCEEKSYQVHDPMHLFVKLPRPLDNLAPLESAKSIVPPLYSRPAGPPNGMALSSSDPPQAYLRNLTHSFALCDRHMTRIVGKWYRCAYCAKDLCADCEKLDTHDETHVFLVFKAPVDMQAFRLFADLDNPEGQSPPVLHGPIYYP